MYIYGTYIPPLERASLSLLHQAWNIITEPLIAPSYNLSHIFPIFSTCAILLSTAPLLPPPYCNPSCCPLASSLLQSSTLLCWPLALITSPQGTLSLLLSGGPSHLLG